MSRSPRRAPRPFEPRAARGLVQGLLGLLGLVLAVGATSAAAHEDDPKARDRRPPFAGAGYRPGTLIRALRAAADRGEGSEPGSAGPAWIAGSEPAVLFPAQGIELLSWVSLADLGVTGGNDCWGWVSPTGREYALVGLSHGTAVVEITDPSDPVVVQVIAGPPSLWRDVKTYGSRAYAVSEGGDGIQVLDLSGADLGVVTHANTVTSGGTQATHNVAIDTTSGFLYRTGGGNHGLRVYSLANPAAPQYAGAWSARYVHDAQVVTYTEGPLAGRQIAFCCSGFNGGHGDPGLTVLDVTVKSQIVVLAQVAYPNRHYSHQAWLSPDRRYLYLNDELDENGITVPTTTHVFDVLDPAAPLHAGTFTNGNRAIGHNLYTRGDLVLEANYRSGLRVFDASDPLHPVETAWFDTWPGDDHPSFNGLWSTYADFPSGLVIGSDMEKGLFVWWLGERELDFGHPAGRPVALDPAGALVRVTLTPAPGAPGASVAPGTATLGYDAGGALVEVPLVPLGGDLYETSLPPLAPGTAVEWFVTARSTSGVRWSDPPQAPYALHRSFAALGATVVLEDDAETDTGWTVGALGDDAVSGHWVLGDPVGTASQPDLDHSVAGTRCWHTGHGAEDVDQGRTSLVSPRLDLSAVPDPVIEYARWFSRHIGGASGLDRLRVEASNDDGASWVLFEEVAGSGGTSVGAWRVRAHRLRDHLAPTDAVRLRFSANDEPLDSAVEAGIDDLRVIALWQDCDGNGVADHEDLAAGTADCNGNGLPDACDLAAGTSADADQDGVPDECCDVTRYCAATPNSSGAAARLDAQGSTSLAANDLVLVASELPPGQNGLVICSPDAAETPLGNGVLCLGTQTLGFVVRLPFEVSDTGGVLTHAVDLAASPVPEATFAAGSTWRFQAWFRDVPAGGAGFDFSDALAIRLCP